MLRISSLCGPYPLPQLDVRTGSNRVAARDAAERAWEYGNHKYYNWDEVQVDFGDGSRPMRGDELGHWIARHFPELLDRY